MSAPDIAEILKLPVEERMRLIELIWESLSANPSSLPLSDAHLATLNERLAEHERDPEDILTIDEALSEVRDGR
ncbi:MAG TPA: addiction module protein [Burkholderiales bacterium]|nr:addiction module protein [Burkholderiales bacterium]